MPEQALQILLVDDTASYLQPVSEALRAQGLIARIEQCGTLEAFQTILGSQAWDVVLSGYAVWHEVLPALEGKLPFIVLCESHQEDAAFSLTHPDISDILPVTHLKRLPYLLRRELRLRAPEDRTQFEEVLAQSKIRYRRTIDNMLEGFQILSFDWHYLYLNDSAARHGRRTKEDLLGHTLLEMYPGFETTRMFAVLRQCMEERIPQQLEYLFTYPDNSSAWFELSIQPVPEGILVLSLDITGRKQAEEAATRYAQRMEVLHQIDLSLIQGDSISALVDSTLRHLRALIPCQQISVALLNETTHEALLMTGGSDTTLAPLPPGYFESFGAATIRVIDDIQLHPEFYSAYKPLSDEGTRSLLHILLISQERPVGVLVLNADTPGFFTPEYQEIAAEIANQLAVVLRQWYLTEELARHAALLEQRVTERTNELQVAKERAEAILNNSPNGILLAHDGMKIQQTNLTFNRLFACEPDDYVGRSLLDLVHPDDVDHAQNVFQTGGSGQRFEILARRKDGTVFTAELSIGHIKHGGLVCSITDITERKRTEAALQRYAAEIEDLYNNAPVGYHSLDRDGGYIQINDTELRWLGLTRDEVIGRLKFGDIVTSRGKETFQRTFPQFLERGWVKNLEFDLVCQDGTEMPVLLSAIAIYDETGQFMASRSTMYDVTDIKAAEAALRESEARYRLLAENVTDVISKVRPDGVCTFITPSCYALLGYTPEELIGNSGLDIIHPDDLFEAQKITMETVIASKSSYLLTHRVRHKAGFYLWVEVLTSIVCDPSTGIPVEFIGIMRDINDRKKTEEALQESEARFRHVVEAAPDHILVYDTNGIIQMINPAALRDSGYTQDDLIGHSVTEFFPPESRLLFEQTLPHILERGSYHEEEQFVRKDGSIALMDCSGSVIFGEDDRPQSVIVLRRDITQRKQVENALHEALTKEKELSELKSRFVSMASHEFRTPLATILASTETLMAYRSRLGDGQIEQRLVRIKEQVGHLKAIMEDVLLLAQMQARRVTFNPVLLDLDALCRSVLDEFLSRPDVEHQLVYIHNGDVGEVKLDRKLVRQIISNLVHNSIKYSPIDQPVTIQLEQTPDEVTLKVQDKGIGIPEADQKHLFEPFHRAANVGTTSGTGLGLVITKESVELHGGTISVESQVGVGTLITVSLPLKPEGEPDNDEHSGD